MGLGGVCVNLLMPQSTLILLIMYMYIGHGHVCIVRQASKHQCHESS